MLLCQDDWDPIDLYADPGAGAAPVLCDESGSEELDYAATEVQVKPSAPSVGASKGGGEGGRRKRKSRLATKSVEKVRRSCKQRQMQNPRQRQRQRLKQSLRKM